MPYFGGEVHIFAEAELSEYLDSLRDELKATVHRETAEYLLNVNEEDYIQRLLGQFKLEPLEIHFDDIYVTTREEQIPTELFPSISFMVRKGESYPKQVITYHIPHEGTEDNVRGAG